MRIIIEIDGVELVPTLEHPQVTAEVSPGLTVGPAAPTGLTPPAKVLRAAAALGAENAGPPPAEIAALNLADIPISAMHRALTEDESKGIDAGAGPIERRNEAPETRKKKKR